MFTSRQNVYQSARQIHRRIQPNLREISYKEFNAYNLKKKKKEQNHLLLVNKNSYHVDHD